MSWENEPTTCCASAQGQRPNRRFAASGKNPISATTPRSKARGWFRSRIRATVLQPLAPCAENLQRLLESYQKENLFYKTKRRAETKRILPGGWNFQRKLEIMPGLGAVSRLGLHQSKPSLRALLIPTLLPATSHRSAHCSQPTSPKQKAIALAPRVKGMLPLVTACGPLGNNCH